MNTINYNTQPSHRRRKRQSSFIIVIFCSLLVFGFSVLHGVDNAAEQCGLCSVSLIGSYFGIRSYKHAKGSRRLLISAALALIICSMVFGMLFNSSGTDAPSARPQPVDSGGQ